VKDVGGIETLRDREVQIGVQPLVHQDLAAPLAADEVAAGQSSPGRKQRPEGQDVDGKETHRDER
jgi:hypothetical protein